MSSPWFITVWTLFYTFHCCLAIKRYGFLDQDSQSVIGRTRHMTSPIWSPIDWFAGPKINIVELNFAELEIDKTVHLKLCLLFNIIFQFTDS